MPSYIYKAKKDAANTITGQINAQNQDEALDLIHQLGLIPVSIEESTSSGVLVSEIRTIKIKNKEVYYFSKQLSGLIKSGVPLLKALEVIGEQSKNPYFSKVIHDVAIGVKSGRSFSSCLSDYPKVFSSLFVAMIRAGEEMGRLREMLVNIADFLKKQEDFSTKVRSALVYPSIMLIVGVTTVFFILTFVLPKMTVIFADSGQKMPLPTVIVMGISRFLRKFYIPILLVFSAGFLFFVRWRRTPSGQIAIGQILLSIPGVRDFVLKADLARFSRTLHLLLQSGLPLVKSIELAVPTIHNPQLKRDLLEVGENLIAGENLGTSLGRSTLMPALTVQAIAVGEESGSLTESLSDIADAYESDIDEITKVITTMLEPLMILGIGLVVGLIVFAMLLPIFSMDLMSR